MAAQKGETVGWREGSQPPASLEMEMISPRPKSSLGGSLVLSEIDDAIEATHEAERNRRNNTRRSVAAALHASHVLSVMKRKAVARRKESAANELSSKTNGSTTPQRKRMSRQVTQLLSQVNEPGILDSDGEIDAISPTRKREGRKIINADGTEGLLSPDGARQRRGSRERESSDGNNDLDPSLDDGTISHHADDQESHRNHNERSNSESDRAAVESAQRRFAGTNGNSHNNGHPRICGGIAGVSTSPCCARCVFMPGSLALGLWDLFIGTFVLAQLVYAVMVMCYADQCFPTIMLLVSGSVRICINLLDFIFNARIAYIVPLESPAVKAFRTLGARESGSGRRQSLRRKQFANRMQSVNHIDDGMRITSKTRASMRQMAVFEHLSDCADDTVLVTGFRALLDDYVLSQGLAWFSVDLGVALIPAELVFSAVFHPSSEFLEHLDASVRARIVTNQTSDPSAPTTFLFLLLFLPAILKAAKLLTTSRLSDSISHTLSRLRTAGGSAENVLSVLWLFAFLLIFAHTAACFFYLIARYEAFSAHSRTGEQLHSRYSATYSGASDPPSWVHAQGLENEGFLPRFVTALYWSTVTLTSTGYGDVIPVTYLERWYNVIVCLLGALVYATIFGRVTTMFNSMNTMNDLYRKKFTQVNRFMAVYGLPTEMRMRIRKQVKFDWALTSGVNVDDVISELPYSLQVEVRRSILQDSLENMPLMQQIGKEAITALLMFMNVRQCISGTCIIKEGDPATQMFFVKSGRLAVLKDGKKIHTLTDGAIFGEVGLLLGLARTASIVSETRSVYFALAGDAYARIMCMYPRFHELLERRALARLQGAIDSDARAASLVHQIATTTITKTNSLVASELLVDTAFAMAEREGMVLDHKKLGRAVEGEEEEEQEEEEEAEEAGEEEVAREDGEPGDDGGVKGVGTGSVVVEGEEGGVSKRGMNHRNVSANVSQQLLAQMTQLLSKVQRMEDQIDHLMEMDKISSTTERWRAWNV
jgi:hypothetical protein